MLCSVTLAVGLIVISTGPHDSYSECDCPSDGCGDYVDGGCEGCGLHCHGRPHVVKDFLFPRGDMHQHLRYDPANHGYYYFRPYNYTQIARHQQFAAAHGGDPRHPYANTLFDQLHANIVYGPALTVTDPPALTPPLDPAPPELPAEPEPSPSDRVPLAPSIGGPQPPISPPLPEEGEAETNDAANVAFKEMQPARFKRQQQILDLLETEIQSVFFADPKCEEVGGRS